MIYKIEIRETLSRQVQIAAPNIDIAKRLVKEKYLYEQLVLGSEDFLSVDFIVDNKW
jgi:hypothetical protein